MSATPTPRGRAVSGVAGLLLIALVVWTALAAYSGAFLSTVPVTIKTSRVGLGLLPGNKIMLNGVQVGRVSEIDTPAGGVATITADIDKKALQNIPRNTEASVDATTFFGPKVISLVPPAQPDSANLQANDTITAAPALVEIDDLFIQVNRLLTSVDPAKVNVVLSGLATSLEGRGTQLSDLVGELGRYVTVVNAHLPAIDKDIAQGTRFTRGLNRATPDVLELLEDVEDLGDLLIDVKPDLRTFLASLNSATGKVDALVRTIDEPLTRALAEGRGPLALLSEYAPQFPCMIAGLNEARFLIESVLGTKYPALQSAGGPAPPGPTYAYPDNLPKIVTGVGPHCYGLPRTNTNPAVNTHILFQDGTESAWVPTAGQSTSQVASSSDPFDALFGQKLTDLLVSASGGGQ